MSLTDLNGRFVMVNDTLETMLGYGPGELIDVQAASLLHPDDIPSVEALRSELLAGMRDHWTHELRARRERIRCAWTIPRSARPDVFGECP